MGKRKTANQQIVEWDGRMKQQKARDREKNATENQKKKKIGEKNYYLI